MEIPLEVTVLVGATELWALVALEPAAIIDVLCVTEERNDEVV